MLDYIMHLALLLFFFFFNDTATTEIYTLSLHDALPIWFDVSTLKEPFRLEGKKTMGYEAAEQLGWSLPRSEEHTSELQSRLHLVCRLLLEKKKNHLRPHDVQRPQTLHRYHNIYTMIIVH